MATIQEAPAARVELQLRQDQFELIEDAAFASGQSVSDFLASAFIKLSQDILDREPSITGASAGRPRLLTDRDRDIILALIDDDQEPNEALKEAAGDYKRRLANGSIQTC